MSIYDIMRNTTKYKNNRYLKRWSQAKKAFDYLGGKCKQCGEDHVAALSFHHRDPSEKEYLVSRLLQKVLPWNEIEEEVKKCDLLCENCHRKLHFDQKRFDKNYEAISLMASGKKIAKEIKMNRWTPDDVLKLKEMYESGCSIHEISHKLGRVEGTIRKKIKLFLSDGVLQDRPKPLRKSEVLITDEIKKLVFDLNQKFVSAFEISRQTGISLGRVHKLIKSGEEK